MARFKAEDKVQVLADGHGIPTTLLGAKGTVVELAEVAQVMGEPYYKVRFDPSLGIQNVSDFWLKPA